jgi:hypothetical protein
MGYMQAMSLTFILFLLPSILLGQTKPYEIFGSFSGEYNSKIYLFFDGHYRLKDSLSCEIKDGKLYRHRLYACTGETRFG